MSGSDGRRGRPPDPHLDVAVRRAVREVLAEQGWRGMSMEAVATRAGVARTTLYRRYGTLSGVLIAMMGDVHDQVPVPDTGSLRDDLVEITRDAMEIMRSPAQADFIAAIFAEQQNPQDGVGQAMSSLLRARREQSMAMVHRAVERAELGDAETGDLLLDLIGGFVLQRIMLRKLPPTRELAERVVDLILDGAV